MLRLSGTLVSRILCSGYGMSAAQVADVIRQRVDPLDVEADAVPPAVCREVPALAPQGRDRPRHPSMQRAETEHRDELTMIETNSDLENTKQRLVEAADALRRLTMNAIKPSGLRSQWPDVILRVEEGTEWQYELHGVGFPYRENGTLTLGRALVNAYRQTSVLLPKAADWRGY